MSSGMEIATSKAHGNIITETMISLPNASIKPDSSSNTTVANQFRQEPVAIILWSILYGALVLVGFLGNVGICWIVYFNKRMRTVTNYFLANTAVADAIVVVFNTLFNFTYAIHGEWYFGRGFCHFMNLVPIAAVFASILSITVISLDRFVVIVYPFRRRISKNHVAVILAIIWISSLSLAFPQCYYAYYTWNQGRQVCFVKWPDPTPRYGTHHLIYQITFLTISYFLPLLVLSASYIILGKKLWGAQSMAVGDLNYCHQQKLKNNRRAVKMMMLVVVTFALCWLPYHIFFFIGFVDASMFEMKAIQQVFLAIFWIAMSSTLYNPFIYCWNNHRFRREFKKLLLLQCRKTGLGCPPICESHKRLKSHSFLSHASVGEQPTSTSQNRQSLIQKTEVTNLRNLRYEDESL